MWFPKHENNDIYVGKMARIYYKDKHPTNIEYIEGELIYIRETKPNTLSIQILDNINKYTKHTCTNDIIKKIEIEMFEIGENVNDLCDKILIPDLSNEVNKYLDNYIEI